MNVGNHRKMSAKNATSREHNDQTLETRTRHANRYRPLTASELLDSDHVSKKNIGWDAYSEEYATTVANNRIYQLSKYILYQIIEEHVVPVLSSKRHGSITVLDFNCGTGNDFPYFLSKGWNIVGCDGSWGMLQRAARRFRAYLKNGRILLYQGNASHFNAKSIDNAKFDLIFSTTGSMAYVTDQQFVRLHYEFRKMLTSKGFILTAHLTPFSIGETLYCILRGHPKMAFRRLKKTLRLNIKGEYHQMHLRSVIRIIQLLRDVLPNVKLFPILTATPPFQTGFQDTRWIELLRIIECKASRLPILSVVADQVALLYNKESPSVS